MNALKVYIGALLDLTLIGIATLSELDTEVRIAAGLVGIVLAAVTGVKMLLQIRMTRIELRRKRLELAMKEEEVRRFFAEKYNNVA